MVTAASTQQVGPGVDSLSGSNLYKQSIFDLLRCYLDAVFMDFVCFCVCIRFLQFSTTVQQNLLQDNWKYTGSYMDRAIILNREGSNYSCYAAFTRICS